MQETNAPAQTIEADNSLRCGIKGACNQKVNKEKVTNCITRTCNNPNTPVALTRMGDNDQIHSNSMKIPLFQDDKYSLAIHNKARKPVLLWQAKSNKTFKKWDAQNQDKFGFIPPRPTPHPGIS